MISNSKLLVERFLAEEPIKEGLLSSDLEKLATSLGGKVKKRSKSSLTVSFKRSRDAEDFEFSAEDEWDADVKTTGGVMGSPYIVKVWW